MKHSRRDFFEAAALLAATPLVLRVEPFLRLQPASQGRKVFLHGLASGDPLADRVILWTRVSGQSPAEADVRWEVATDP